MSEETLTHCVFIPCSESEIWAVPQNCLAELLTVSTTSETPPDAVSWRGLELPVLDFGSGGQARWSEQRVGTGLVAIFLGLQGEDCEYWGVAVRGDGLAMTSLSAGRVVDAPGEAVEHATAAFRYKDVLYQVPDLDGLQKKLADSLQVA